MNLRRFRDKLGSVLEAFNHLQLQSSPLWKATQLSPVSYHSHPYKTQAGTKQSNLAIKCHRLLWAHHPSALLFTLAPHWLQNPVQGLSALIFQALYGTGPSHPRDHLSLHSHDIPHHRTPYPKWLQLVPVTVSAWDHGMNGGLSSPFTIRGGPSRAGLAYTLEKLAVPGLWLSTGCHSGIFQPVPDSLLESWLLKPLILGVHFIMTTYTATFVACLTPALTNELSQWWIWSPISSA